MATSTWDDPTPTPRRIPWMGILLALAVAGGLIALLAGSLAGLSGANRSMAWPLTRNVVQRLQTDEGARDLWRRNPDLASTWEGEEAFVLMSRTHRQALATLPPQEPHEHQDRLWISASPGDLRVLVRTESGPWLHLYADTHSGQGEGLFAIRVEAPGSLGDQLKAMTRIHGAMHRTRFTQALDALAEDATARAWLIRETGLPPGEVEPLLAEARRLRPQLPTLRAELQAEKARVRRSSRQVFFQRTTTREFTASNGARLRLTYTQGRLSGLAVRLPGEAP